MEIANTRLLKGVTCATVTLCIALGVAAPQVARADVYAVQTIATGHFNRKAADPGMDDIVVGSPRDIADGGSVTIYWWDVASASRRKIRLTQSLLLAGFIIKNVGVSATINDTMPGDHFGAALAVGDFNGDGLSDLAIGAPDEDPVYPSGSVTDAGVVHILYGTSGQGFAGTPFRQDTLLLPNPYLATGSGVDRTGEQFGYALSASNFDAIGSDDLAVGTPGAHGFSTLHLGRVYLYQGAGQTMNISIDGSFVENPTGRGDEFFGGSLATGRFRTGGLEASSPYQLAVGAWDGQVGSRVKAGFVVVYVFPRFFLKPRGFVVPDETDFYDQTSISPPNTETTEAYDHFGFSLAAVPTRIATAAGPTQHLLLIGAPWEDAGQVNTGVVHLFSPDSLVSPQVIYSNTLGLARQTNAFFGKTLAGGYIRRVAGSPLLSGAIIGEPGRNSNAGAAYHVGETPTLREQLSAIEIWTPAVPVAGDFFGEGVAVGSFGPSEAGQTTPVVGKSYVANPNQKKVIQFNVDATSSVRNEFVVP